MTNVSWKNLDGTWRTGADWSTNQPPGTLDTAVLGSAAPHSVTHDSGSDTVASIIATTDSLDVTGGTLTVTGTADLGAGLAMTGGILALGGSATVPGTTNLGSGIVSIASGETLTLSGAVSLGTNGRNGPSVYGPGALVTSGVVTLVPQTGNDLPDLFLAGNGTWTDSGTVSDAGQIVYGSNFNQLGIFTIDNVAGATFDLSTDNAGIVANLSGDTATFINAGLLEKTGGTTSSTIQATINNTGTLLVDSGFTLYLEGGGTLGGSLVTDGTAVLALEAGNFTLTDATVTADLLLDGGNATVSTATALHDGLTESSGGLTIAADTSESDATAILDGSLSIASGETLTLSGAVSLGTNGRNGPSVYGPGALVTSGVVTLVPQTGNDLPDLFLAGNGTWTDSGTVSDAGQIVYGSNFNQLGIFTIDNVAGATFDLSTDNAGIVANLSGDTATFINAGLLEKTGGTTSSTIQATINNTGTLLVDSGFTLYLEGGGTLGGSLVTDGTAVLALEAGNFTLTDATVTADLLLDGGNATVSTATALHDGLTESSGGLTIAADTSESDATAILDGSLSIASGETLTLSGAVSLGTNGRNGPSVYGPGALVTSGVVTLVPQTGNDLPDLFLAGNGTWTNSGTVSDAGQIVYGSNFNQLGIFTIDNVAGATFDLSTDNAGIVANLSGDTATFINAGLLETTRGTTSSTIQATINNTGTIAATSGTLDLTGAIAGSGILSVGNHATLKLDGTIANGQVINFEPGGTDETVTLGVPASTTSLIENFGTGDKITFAGNYSSVGLTFSTNTTDVLSNGHTIATLHLVGDYNSSNTFVQDVSGVVTVSTTLSTQVSSLLIAGTQADQTTTDQAAIDPFSGVTIAETGSVTETATVTLSTTADGTLFHLGSGSYDATTGIYIVSGSTADVTAALDGLMFTPIGFQVAPGDTVTTGFDLTVNSTSGATASDNTTSVVATAAAVWDIAAGATLEIPGASHGQTIDFLGSTGLLRLDQPPLSELTVAGFVSGDHIDLVGVSSTITPVLAGGTLTLGALHLGFSGDYTGQVFSLVTGPGGAAELMVATPVTASGRQTLRLGSGDANVTQSGYANHVTGTGTGDAVAQIGVGLNNLLSLGNGNNVVTTQPGGAYSSVTLGDGINTVNLGGTLNTVRMGNGADTVAIAGTNNDVTAGNGPDSVTGGTDNNSVALGDGMDAVALGGWGNSVTVGDGDDTIDPGAGGATLHLGEGNDTVVLHGRSNVVTGGDGDDSVTGGALGNSVSLGNGDDTVALGGQGNSITLGDGANTVSAGSGADHVHVGGGANSIAISGTYNSVVGGNGNDSVVGTQASLDSVTLGDGADTVALDGNYDTVTVGNGADSVSIGGVGNMVTGGNGGVTVTGGTAHSTVTLGTGNNSVTLGGWVNSVSIGGGTSSVDAGAGASTIDVAGGNASLTLHGRADLVFLHNAAQASIADQSAGLRLGIDSGNVVAAVTGFGASSGAVVDLAGAGFSSVAQVLAGLASDGHGGTLLALGGTGHVDFLGLAPGALHSGNFSLV